MRIIGGARRGLRLAEVGPGDPSAHLRPTTDRVREAIFNLILNGPYGDPVAGARVLDLFAGSGALGLEALSRGAGHVTFVDDGAAAQALVARNIALMRAADMTDRLRRDATRLGPNRGAPYGLVFLDPPYGHGLAERALSACIDGGWLAPRALVVCEDSTPPAVPPPLSQLDQRRYGDTVVTIARMTG